MAGKKGMVRRRTPPEAWAIAIERVRQGETLSHFLGEPGMPTMGAWYARRQADPSFRALSDAAMALHSRSGRRTDARHYRAYVEQASTGAPLKKITAGVHPRTIGRLRKCNADFAERFHAIRPKVSRLRGRRPYLQSEIDRRIIEAVESGAAIRQLKQIGLPGQASIHRKRKRNPEFAAALAEARLRGERKSQLDQIGYEAAFARIGKALPATLERSARDEIQSEMMVALMEGDIDPSDIKAHVAEFISEYFASYADKWGDRSLSESVGDGNRTLGDVIGA